MAVVVTVFVGKAVPLSKLPRVIFLVLEDTESSITNRSLLLGAVKAE